MQKQFVLNQSRNLKKIVDKYYKMWIIESPHEKSKTNTQRQLQNCVANKSKIQHFVFEKFFKKSLKKYKKSVDTPKEWCYYV